MLRARVAAGELPPVEERLPEEPLVLGPGDAFGFESLGQYGGVIEQDTGDATGVQAHVDAAPMAFDGRRLLPLVWKSCTHSDDFRVWTIELRRGMKWSDGHPYTTEDVIFWYEAVCKNRELTPLPEGWMLEDGEPFRIEKVDDVTFRCIFKKPRLNFLAPIRTGNADLMGCPKHYLSQFHPQYASRKQLDELIADAGMDSWTQLWEARFDRVNNSNPERPVLYPWLVKVPIPANPARYERNPYFWIVDSQGRQLPYADELRYTIVGNDERMKLRMVLGLVSFARISLNAAELAKLQADKGNIRIGLSPPPGDINAYTLAFNLLAPDPFRRELLNDRRFRFAMSLQMPRHLINEIIDNGMTQPKQIGVSDPTHPWYNEKLANAHLAYDLDEANRLLDEMGLTDRNADGMRLTPDGEPIVLTFITTDHHQWQPAAEIIAEQLHKVGLKANLRLVTWTGQLSAVQEAKWDLWLHQDLMGYPYAWPDRMEAVRPSQWNGYQWYRWMDTGGQAGIEPPSLMKQCWGRWQAAQSAATEQELTEAIQWLQTTAADQLWAVGVNSFPPQLWVIAPHIRNVPMGRGVFLFSAVYCTDRTKRH